MLSLFMKKADKLTLRSDSPEICLDSSEVRKHRITAIVPAYNEEKKILNVLKVLTESRYLHEVICVNDGSSDSTLKIIKKVKDLKVINLKKNHGKAYAVSRGVLKAKGDIVLFVDADIDGFCDKYINLLTEPLLKGKCHVVVGCRSGKFEAFFFKQFGGERAYFKKDLLSHLKVIEGKGYGLELYLNYIFRNRKINLVRLDKVFNTWKHSKQSFWIATRMTALVVFDLFTEIFRQKNPVYYYFSSCMPFYDKERSLINILISRYKFRLNRNKYVEMLYRSVNFAFPAQNSFRRVGSSFSRSTAVYSGISFVILISALLLTVSSMNIKYKGFDSTKISSTLYSYKKYEKIIIANVVEPVKAKYLKNILNTREESINNYTTGFLPT